MTESQPQNINDFSSYENIINPNNFTLNLKVKLSELIFNLYSSTFYEEKMSHKFNFFICFYILIIKIWRNKHVSQKYQIKFFIKTIIHN